MATIKLKKGYNLNLEGSIATSTVASAPSREPKRDTDIPLYGKISVNNEE